MDITPSKVASAAARRGEELVAEIGRKSLLIRETFVDIAEALVEIEKKKLYAAMGYERFEELLEERGIMGRSQAYKLMAIARHIPRSDALSLGPEKAYAIVRYAKATAALDVAPQILQEGIVVNRRRRPVADLSVREIADLASVSRQNRRNATDDPERHEALAAASEAERNLRKRGIRGVAVTVRKKAGAWVATVTLPLAALDKV